MTQISAAPTTPTTGISTDTSRLSSRANLDQAGDKFEAVFTKMMLTAMRKTKLADSLFESKALDTFRDMQDDQVAHVMAANAPMGIGKAVTAFLAKANGDLAAPAATPDPVKADVNRIVPEPGP